MSLSLFLFIIVTVVLLPSSTIHTTTIAAAIITILRCSCAEANRDKGFEWWAPEHGPASVFGS